MTPEQARTLAATVKAEHERGNPWCAGADRVGHLPCAVWRLTETVETLTARLDQPWSGWVYVGADDDLPPLASLAHRQSYAGPAENADDGTADPP